MKIMDIYKRKSRWKIYLGMIGLLIISLSFWYTNNLVRKLAKEEENKVRIWSSALSFMQKNTSEDLDLDLISLIQNTNKTIPLMLVNDRGTIDDIRNFNIGEPSDTASIQTLQSYIKKNKVKLEEILNDLKASGNPPIVIESADNSGDKQYIYYKHSTLLNSLKYYPYIQFLLISAFILLAYIGFSSSRKAEQNRVWVGMAKETAHQLGTPISAIIAWIEHLKQSDPDEVTDEILNELRNDVSKLELVADRFSKIGAEPEFTKSNLYELLDRSKTYMQRRAPRKVHFEFPNPQLTPIYANVNEHLLEWVFENLLRNSLDAMGGEGTISGNIYIENNYACIDLSDTGKGIPPAKFKTVFEPGYSTKLRGWGLGLSLAHRIINYYHKGKIFVKKSSPGGTVFTIKLPLVNN